jgi:thioredoxin 1
LVPERSARKEINLTGAIIDVTDANFDVEVLESETPVVVDFWAPWCGPCRVVSPILEQINAERDDLRVVKLNVDENQQTAVKYEILSIPTMILFKDGQIAKKVIGALPKARLEAELVPALA